MAYFGTMITAMVTPFKESGEVDYDQAKRLAKHLIQEGNDGLVVCGTTGESPVLSKQEKLKMFETVKEAIGEKPVIAGTGSNVTAQTIELSLDAVSAGADALLLVAPYYNKPSQEGLKAHFSAVLDKVDADIMLYNIPGRCGIEIAAETLAELAQASQVRAVKQSLPGLDSILELQHLIEARGLDFEQYSGDDAYALAHYSVGMQGVVSVAGHLIAGVIKDCFALLEVGQREKAFKKYSHYLPLMQGLFMTSNPVPVKYALAKQGYVREKVSLPLAQLTSSQRVQMDELLESFSLLHAKV